MKLDARAGARIGEHLGDDLGRLEGLLGSLASAYGESTISEEDSSPTWARPAGCRPGTSPTRSTRGTHRPPSVPSHGCRPRREERRCSPCQSSTATTPDAASRRLGGDDRCRGGGGDRCKERVPGPQGSRPVESARVRADRPGDLAYLQKPTWILVGGPGLSDEAVLQVLVARLSRLTPASRRQGARRRA